MKFIAHRGLKNKTIKENTLEAFSNAIQNEHVDGFEFDVRVTKDNHFVVHHNAFIGADLIKSKNYKYLKNKYHLPLLNEVLSLPTNKIMLVEIKDSNLPYDALIKILNASKKNIYVMSFHNKVIENLKKKGLKKKLGILNYVLNSEEDYSYDFICLLNNLATESLVRKYQKRKIEVFLYGVINEEKDLKIDDVFYIVDEIK